MESSNRRLKYVNCLRVWFQIWIREYVYACVWVCESTYIRVTMLVFCFSFVIYAFSCNWTICYHFVWVFVFRRSMSKHTYTVTDIPKHSPLSTCVKDACNALSTDTSHQNFRICQSLLCWLFFLFKSKFVTTILLGMTRKNWNTFSNEWDCMVTFPGHGAVHIGIVYTNTYIAHGECFTNMQIYISNNSFT